MVNEKTTGLVTSVTPRPVNTKSGPSTAYDVLINGIVISSFRPECKAGDTVEIDYYTNNGYRNAVSTKVLTPAPALQGQTSLPQHGIAPTKFTLTDRIDLGQMMALAEAERARVGSKDLLRAADIASMITLFKEVHAMFE